MEEDAHLAVSILLVAESVLNFGLASICSAGEEVVAHGNGNIATDINLVVVKNHVRPSLSTVDGKTSILKMTLLDRLVPNKVGHGIGGCGSKLGFSCLGWLEQHICVSIAVELTGCFGSSCNVVASVKIGLGDTLDGIGPCCLHTLHFLFSNLCN